MRTIWQKNSEARLKRLLLDKCRIFWVTNIKILMFHHQRSNVGNRWSILNHFEVYLWTILTYQAKENKCRMEMSGRYQFNQLIKILNHTAKAQIKIAHGWRELREHSVTSTHFLPSTERHSMLLSGPCIKEECQEQLLEIQWRDWWWVTTNQHCGRLLKQCWEGNLYRSLKPII
jgi:hypothetical protein